MVNLKKGILRGFNSINYTAVIELTGSAKVHLEDVIVARNIPSADMVVGRKIMIVFFDEHNTKDAIITAVY